MPLEVMENPMAQSNNVGLRRRSRVRQYVSRDPVQGPLGGGGKVEFSNEDVEAALDLMHLELEEPVGLSKTFRDVVADLEVIATFVGADGEL